VAALLQQRSVRIAEEAGQGGELNHEQDPVRRQCPADPRQESGAMGDVV
jgi:hypothetical protein